MKFDKKDVRFEVTKGKGPGGQHKNKTSSCVIAIHEPTGIRHREDGRKQGQNKKRALQDLRRKVLDYFEERRADARKKRRDDRIRNSETIRTYDFNKNLVKDHRSMKTSDLRRFMKGKEDLREFSQK